MDGTGLPRYHETGTTSDEEDGALSDVSKTSSFGLEESRGWCSAACCCHVCYVILFLMYLVVFPLWGKWMVTAPMPESFWHDSLPAFPLLPIRDFDIATDTIKKRAFPEITMPEITMSAIPKESSACNYTCGEELMGYRNNLMNFDVFLTLNAKYLEKQLVHTSYPVLLASEDFKNWQLVADRRNAHPEPFWRSRSEDSGDNFVHTTPACTDSPSPKATFTSQGTYILGCVTWSPEGQQVLQSKDKETLTAEEVAEHCTVVGGVCGWPCGSNVPANRLPNCSLDGIIDPSALMKNAPTLGTSPLGTVVLEGCDSATSAECATSTQPMSMWKCHKCRVEREDTSEGNDPLDNDDPTPLFTPPTPSWITRRLQDEDDMEEDSTTVLKYKSLPRMQVKLQDAKVPKGTNILNTPRAYILASHNIAGPWTRLYQTQAASTEPTPLPIGVKEPETTDTVINDEETVFAMQLEQKSELNIMPTSCYGRRGPLYLVACAVNASIYDNPGLWHDIKGKPRFAPGQKVAPPPFNDRCLAVAGRCATACIPDQVSMQWCRDDGYIEQSVLVHSPIDSEFNSCTPVIIFVIVLFCGFAVKSLMLCPGIFSPYRHAHAYEPEFTEVFRCMIVVSPVAGADENKGTMIRNLVGVISCMPPDCKCRYHAVINDEGHRNEMKSCWQLVCNVIAAVPIFGNYPPERKASYEANVLEFTALWCADTKILGLPDIGGKVKQLDPKFIERLSGQASLKKLLKETKWTSFPRGAVAPLEAACQALANDLSNSYNKFTNSTPYLDNVADWCPAESSSLMLRMHYTSRAKPVEDARNIMVQHVAVGSWYYKVPKHATTEEWLKLRQNPKEMVYAKPDNDPDYYNVPLRSSHGKAGGLNFVDNYIHLYCRKHPYGDERDEGPMLYAIADARHQFQPDFMLSCIPCFFDEQGELNERVAFTQAPQHYPEYSDKTDYMDYNNAQFFRLNAMIRNCCGGVSSCGTNGMWLIPARDDETIWQKRRKRVRDQDSKKRDELIEFEQFHTSCKIEDTASSLDQVLQGRHSHFVNRKLSFGMAKAPTDFIGAQQRWVEGAVTLSLQWFSFNADSHGAAAKNAWMLWVTWIGFLCFVAALVTLVTSNSMTHFLVPLKLIWGSDWDSMFEELEGWLGTQIDSWPVLYKLMGGNDLNRRVFTKLLIQFASWMGSFCVFFFCLWVVTTIAKLFRKCCAFPNEMKWWGRLIISMDNLTYFIWFWTSFFWIGFNYYTALCKTHYHFNNKGMMAFMLVVNSLNWALLICNSFRYNLMESMDANEIAALNMDNVWRANQLFFMTGPIQAFSFVRGIGEFIKYKFYGQDIGGWSGGDLGTISVNIVKYWTTLMLAGCVSVWIAYVVYAHEYQNSFSACIVVTLISLDVLHPCIFLWFGNASISAEESRKMSWFQAITSKKWWSVRIKNFVLNQTFTGFLKYLGPTYFILLPILALFSSYFGVNGAYLLVAMGPGH